MNEYSDTKADKEKSAGGRFKLDWLINPAMKLQYAFNYDYVDQGPFLTDNITRRQERWNLYV